MINLVEIKNNKLVNNADHRQSIRKQAAALAELLYQSPEYAQFLLAKEKLECDEENSSILMNLRQQQMALRMSQIMGEENMDEADAFEDLFILLSQEPIIRDYLFAEGRFFRLVADVEEIFNDKLGFWQVIDDAGLEIYKAGLH